MISGSHYNECFLIENGQKIKNVSLQGHKKSGILAQNYYHVKFQAECHMYTTELNSV